MGVLLVGALASTAVCLGVFTANKPNGGERVCVLFYEYTVPVTERPTLPSYSTCQFSTVGSAVALGLIVVLGALSVIFFGSTE